MSTTAFTRLPQRGACLAACLAALGLAIPAGALATTGTQTEYKVKVTLTDKGAVWAPVLKKLAHPNTGVTYKFTIVNEAASRHWFSVGKHRTKVLPPKGKAEIFFYSFTTPGTVPWVTGIGSVRATAFHGAFTVKFPSQFG
jgi:hypothetical protein